MSNALWWVLGALLALAAIAFAGRAFLRLAFIERQIRRKFPKVPQVSGQELERRLAAGEEIVLLDVRRPEEFAVSHLPGARWLDPRDKEPKLEGVGRAAPVVAYCSVGWRSSQVAERLAAAGYANVANLEGAIFKWTREGRPLFQGERQVAKVHPYSPVWEFLVPKERRAYHPGDALSPQSSPRELS